MFLTGIHGLFHCGFKLLIEAFHHVRPFLTAFSNFIEILFYLSGEVIVHDGWEILHQEVVHHHTDIGRQELSLIRTGHFLPLLLSDHLALQGIDGVEALFALLVSLMHIFALLNGGNGGSISRRTTDAQLFQFMNERSFRIAEWTLAETFCGLNLTTRQFHAFLQRRQHVAFFFLFFIVHRLAIYLDETVEFHHFTLSHKDLVSTTDRNVYCGLVHLGISHLTGYRALPNQFIEFLLLRCSLDACILHVGRTNGFVSFLSTLRTGVILAHLAVFLTIELGNLLLAGVDTQAREVDGVRTHIGNLSVFIQVLSHHHGLTDGKAQFAGSFLLQGRGGERGSGSTLHGLFHYGFNDVGCLFAFLQELLDLFVGLHALGQRSLHFRLRTVRIGNGKNTIDAIVGLAVEILDFAFAFDNQSYCHTLYAACRKRRLHLTPQYGRQFKAYQTVEYTTSLLGIHQIHVQMTRRLDSTQNSWLGNFVEHDTVCFLFVQSQHLTQVPADGFSLAVFIGCQPDFLSLLRIRFQIFDELHLFLWYLVFGFERFRVNTHFLLLQVTDMTIARHHLILLTKKLLYRLGLCRRLYYHQIFLHTIIIVL